MFNKNVHFWAKTVSERDGRAVPGINIGDRCLNVGSVKESIPSLFVEDPVNAMPVWVLL